MNAKLSKCFLIAVSLALTSFSASAQESTLSKEDRKFVTDAAKSGIIEVQMGNYGAQKAQSPAVKQFAQKVSEDHKKANAELKQIVSQKGAALTGETTATTGDAKEMMDEMKNLSGAEFDKAYMKHMVDHHKADVETFKEASKDLKDPELKAYATKTLPTLEQHLAAAEKLQETVGK